MTIKKFDRPTCRKIGEDIEKALQTVAEKYGVTISGGNGSFDSNSFTKKVVVNVKNEDGTSYNKEEEDFKKYANMYGLEDSDLGKTFVSRGGTYKISGLSMKSRKYPILATQVSSGKTYKFTEETIKRKFFKTKPTIAIELDKN